MNAAKLGWLRFVAWAKRSFVDFWFGPNLGPSAIESIIRKAAKTNDWDVDRIELSLEGSVYTAIVRLAREEYQYRILINGNSGETLALGKEVAFDPPAPLTN